MEKQDLALITELSEKKPEVKVLWEEHLLYEKQLDALEKKAVLSPDEERLIKEVKKKKLAGKTKLQNILDRARAEG